MDRVLLDKIGQQCLFSQFYRPVFKGRAGDDDCSGIEDRAYAEVGKGR
jgi:hypothetical protein